MEGTNSFVQETMNEWLQVGGREERGMFGAGIPDELEELAREELMKDRLRGSFKVGERVVHRTAPELGVGVVTAHDPEEGDNPDYADCRDLPLVVWPGGGAGFYDPAVLARVGGGHANEAAVHTSRGQAVRELHEHKDPPTWRQRLKRRTVCRWFGHRWRLLDSGQVELCRDCGRVRMVK